MRRRRPRVVQQHRQRVVRADVLDHDLADPVDRADEPPQLGGRGPVEGEQVDESERAVGVGAVPLVVDPVDGQTGRGAVGVPVDGRERLLPVEAGHLDLAGLALPGQLVPGDHAGLGDPPAVEQLGADLAQLRHLHQVDPPAGHGGQAVPQAAGPEQVDVPAVAPGRGAEAVAAVDVVLGGDQDRDRDAALPGGVQVRGHHPAEQAAPAVRGGHGDGGDRVGRDDRAAGDGQLGVETPEGGHEAAVGQGPDHPARLPLPAPELRRPAHVRAQEAQGQRAVPRLDLVLADRADLDPVTRVGLLPRSAAARLPGPAVRLVAHPFTVRRGFGDGIRFIPGPGAAPDGPPGAPDPRPPGARNPGAEGPGPAEHWPG